MHIMTLPIKNNNVNFEGLDILSLVSQLVYQTHSDTSDNVCLDLQNWRYSIIYIWYI